MKSIKLFYKVLAIILTFSLLQVPQIYAISSDTAHVAGVFAYNVAEMLKNRQTEIDVPPEVYKNDLLGASLNAATDYYPEGDAVLQSIKYSGITKKLTVSYIGTQSKVFILSSQNDFTEVYSIAKRQGLTDFIVAFSVPVTVESFDDIMVTDPEIQYTGDVFVIEYYDKSKSPLKNFTWKYPYVYHFGITPAATQADKDLVNTFVYNSIAPINKNLSVRDKVAQVNKILVSSFAYESIEDPSNVQIHLPSYMVKNGTGVCSAYALLAYKMLDALNVPTLLIEGNIVSDPDILHVWLLVRDENGTWYHFDPTWNDPVPDVKGRVLTDYLYLTDSQMQLTHTWSTTEYNKQNNDKNYEKLYNFNHPQIILGILDTNLMINNILTKVDLNPNITPIIIDNSTYLPLRVIVETLGGSISYDDTTKTVSILLKDKQIQVQINSLYATINGQQATLVAPPIISNDRTLLPVRGILELLEKNVLWDDATRTVTIK